MKLKNKTDSEIVLGAYYNGSFQVSAKMVRPGDEIEISDEEYAMFKHAKLTVISEPKKAPAPEPEAPEAPAPEPEPEAPPAKADPVKEAEDALLASLTAAAGG